MKLGYNRELDSEGPYGNYIFYQPHPEALHHLRDLVEVAEKGGQDVYHLSAHSANYPDGVPDYVKLRPEFKEAMIKQITAIYELSPLNYLLELVDRSRDDEDSPPNYVLFLKYQHIIGSKVLCTLKTVTTEEVAA